MANRASEVQVIIPTWTQASWGRRSGSSTKLSDSADGRVNQREVNIVIVLRLPFAFKFDSLGEAVWIFDARSNVPGITKKERPLTPQHFAEFDATYGKEPNGLSKRKNPDETGRFRKFHISQIKERIYRLGCHLAQGRLVGTN